jgi:hypothetical protein
VSRCGLEATTVGSGGGAGAAAWTGGGGGGAGAGTGSGGGGGGGAGAGGGAGGGVGGGGADGAGGAGVTSGPAVVSWLAPVDPCVGVGRTACGAPPSLTFDAGSPAAKAAAGDEAATSVASVTASGRRNRSVARAKAARLGGGSGRRASGTLEPVYQR